MPLGNWPSRLRPSSQRLRETQRYKILGVLETPDLTSALMALNIRELEPEVIDDTLGVLLKCQQTFDPGAPPAVMLAQPRPPRWKGRQLMVIPDKPLKRSGRWRRHPWAPQSPGVWPSAASTSPSSTRASLGTGASSHSFAWINAGAKEPIGYHNLNSRSLGDVAPFPPPTSAIMEIRPASDSDGAARFPGNPTRWPPRGLVARVRQLQSWGYPTRLIDPGELKRLEPALDFGPVAAAEYSPQRRPGGAANGGRCLPASPSRNGVVRFIPTGKFMDLSSMMMVGSMAW